MKKEIWKSIIRKYENSSNQADFLDKLSSEEFNEYMSERSSDILDMKKDENQTRLNEKEMKIQINEEYFQNASGQIMSIKDQDEISQNQQMDEVYEEFKVFKDCSVQEFEDLFGPKYNDALPLYVNLYILREQQRYINLVDQNSNRYCAPTVIALNTFYYFMRQKSMLNQTFIFARFGRTALLTLFYQIMVTEMFSRPKVR